MNRRRNIAAFVAYAMYLLTGAACVVIGSSIPQLMTHFNKDLPTIAILASAFAIGRVATVFPVGVMTEKVGVKITITMGVLFFLAFLIGIPLTTSYGIAIVLSAIAGVGMSTQDTCCAVILREAFPESYSSSLSAGQAFFSIGCFLSPMLMAIALANEVDFTVVYFMVALVGFTMLLAIPFMKITKDIHIEEVSENKEVEPVKLKNKKWGYAFLGIACFTYFGATNTIHTYTATFVESFGISESISVSILTVYSIGCMAGSFFFIPVLRKVHETHVLWINMLCAFVSLSIAMLCKTTVIFFIMYFVAGFFCGVLFSVLVSIAVSLKPLHAGIAAATIGFVGGIADILSPLLTGAIISVTNIQSTFYYCITMCVLCIASAWGYRMMYRRELDK
ncbi:hypothetical protein CS063_15270 [Sporanaerobium hydrogeniformans]|uniref:Uncharacterized protein n=1 Tax=Sporanaerobium hydrogeniformans TaxID=3072179 RepID=A0AC61D9T4_9FIRM|nr:MFS transporter [Sporanaerobium hydrogeniformans]PHV69535.1 hypothetical protein CS063_15270 [Sporanaerobium hydrogeniformans]